MIDYLTVHKYANYNPFQLPSRQGGGGGIHLKTFFVGEALRERYRNVRLISNAREIENDVVLIEPLRFRVGVRDDDEPVDLLLDGLKRSDARKILFCTEFAIATFDPKLRAQLVGMAGVVTTSCKFIRRIARYVGVPSHAILRDPISEIYESPIEDFAARQNQVVASGNISYIKNTEHTIKVFERLAGVVKRVYVGSHSLWSDASKDKYASNLQDELYANCDEVIREATLPQLAKILYKSKFGLWNCIHDATATTVMAMLRAGILVVGSRHGYGEEIPIAMDSGVERQAQLISKLAGTDAASLAEQSAANVRWCRENISYRAWLRQLEEVLSL